MPKRRSSKSSAVSSPSCALAIAAESRRIRQSALALAEIDVLLSFAHLAALRNYCRPQFEETPDDSVQTLEILEGRHPVIEQPELTGSNDRFVPNDLYLDASKQSILLITGPNMGGKSTYLRQTALIVLMAQMGSFVPATRARLSTVDRIFTRIGASDNLARGRSTFMVEMTETAAILNTATPRSLILLDEIGRGTATYDGLAIAWAVVEFIHQHSRAKTLFATHYHELTELEDAARFGQELPRQRQGNRRQHRLPAQGLTRRRRQELRHRGRQTRRPSRRSHLPRPRGPAPARERRAHRHHPACPQAGEIRPRAANHLHPRLQHRPRPPARSRPRLPEPPRGDELVV